MAARERLQADGIGTAVVSMPCWELFEAETPAYRDAVLGPAGARVAIEAAVTFGWERHVGERGRIVGLTGFGASAPAGELFAHFGLTPDAVVTAVKEQL
jgi:transketolase